jgi:HD-GYP domain-containing protein (c-di-GMP phosphodiesterase class II)
MAQAAVEDNKVLIEVPVEVLRLGLYVHTLDRPWEGTPFLFQGFELDSEDDIRTIQGLCRRVTVLASREEAGKLRAESSTAEKSRRAPVDAGPDSLKLIENDPKSLASRVPEKDPVTFKAELNVAAEALGDARKQVNGIFDRVRSGAAVDPKELTGTMDAMVNSVFRNRDAMGWLARMRSKDDYVYSHSLATSVWALTFGRHLGLDKETLKILGTGAMLLDIGKTRIPDRLLKKPEAPNPTEWKLLQLHTRYGAKLVAQADNADPRIVSMIEMHHERFDGTGYPHGLKGDEIPLIARVAAIVDAYDAMISERAYAKAKSAYDAVRELMRQSGKAYQPELVDLFVQAVGVFPTGTLVELNTGEVGVVVAQNRFRRLRPEVTIILDADKKLCADFTTVNLLTCAANSDADKPGLWIERALEHGAYGIDPAEYFL